VGHDVDHAIRHNAVGWPPTDEVDAFTASLVGYPVTTTGLLLYRARSDRTGRLGTGAGGASQSQPASRPMRMASMRLRAPTLLIALDR
jgi:hypothetical protein